MFDSSTPVLQLLRLAMVALLAAGTATSCSAVSPDQLDAGEQRDGGTDTRGRPDTGRPPSDFDTTEPPPDVVAPDATDDEDAAGPDDAALPPDVGDDDVTLDVEPVPDVPVVRPDTGPPVDECGEVAATAEGISSPVDIVWVIDTSGSMNEEALLVQTNLNAFVAFLDTAGLDYRVVMVAADSVCVPEPLSGGGCPDTDGERYLHVRQTIGSTNALEQLVSTYPQYQPFLRPDASLHFVVVTDDESRRDATWFINQMNAVSPAVPSFTFHTIASLTGSETCFLFICVPSGCSGPNGDAEAQGRKYMDLSTRTGGVQFSICEADWSPVFTDIGASVIREATLPCEYGIPEVDFGEIVWEEVTVEIDGVPLSRVENEAACGVGEAWFYDDIAAPTRIELCPRACGGGREGRELEIIFGCVKA